jgi:hypothetical protein
MSVPVRARGRLGLMSGGIDIDVQQPCPVHNHSSGFQTDTLCAQLRLFSAAHGFQAPRSLPLHWHRSYVRVSCSLAALPLASHFAVMNIGCQELRS